MAAQSQPLLTPEEYLEIERASEFRHEYYKGRMYLMAGGSPRHAFIILNLASELRYELKNRPCSVATSDLRIAIAENGLYTYPDIVVGCGELKYTGARRETLANPTLLIEVLSPPTELLDREFKAEQYRKILSLREYAFVSQREARVEIYRRTGEEWRLFEFIGIEASARFESVDTTIPLAEIYSKISLDEPESALHPADQ